MNLRAVIVDDERHCRITLKKLVEWADVTVEIVGEAEHVDGAKKIIKELKPDLVFLDIEMPEKNGFDLLHELDKLPFDVIFTTAYDEFAIEAFNTNAVAYLLKPIDQEELKGAVQKVQLKKEHTFSQDKLLNLFNALSNQDQKFQKISVPTADGLEFIKVDDLTHITADGNYSQIHIRGQKPLLISKTLKYMERLLEHYQFIRPHNSHLINVKYIKRYNKGVAGSLTLEDGTVIPVSRHRKEEVNKFF